MTELLVTRERPRRAARPEPEAPSTPRRRRRRLPLACWLCVAIAIANALVWASITPAFQVPDEPVHIGYAQYVAETGKIPRPLSPYWQGSQEAAAVFSNIPWSLTGKPNWTAANNRHLDSLMHQPLSRISELGAGYGAANPPLYYLLAAVPYRIAYGGTFLDRVYAMRVLSALLAGLTTLFVFLFVRELVPRPRWAATLGALAIALQPVFGFIGGGVNNDNLLWAASAAMFWLVARAFRRGLTPGAGAGIGLALAVAVLTKTSALAFVPGLAVGLALLAWRDRTGPLRRRLTGLGTAALTAAVPIGGWLLASDLLLSRAGATGAGFTNIHGSLRGQLSYLWQFWLPKLPWQHSWFAGYPGYPLWETYFKGFVGRFGWFYFGFPNWVYLMALGVALGVVALAVNALVRGRAGLRRRWAEMLCYVLLAGGMLLLVNVAGYRYRIYTGTGFEQTRYIFPLLPLYAGLVAVASRGAGRRLGPVFAVAFIGFAAADSIFSQLLSIGHYFA